MRSSDFNVHDLLKIRANVNIGIPSIFKVSEVDPNLTIYEGNFDVEDVKGSEFQYYESGFGPLKSKFLLSDIGSVSTRSSSLIPFSFSALRINEFSVRVISSIFQKVADYSP